MTELPSYDELPLAADGGRSGWGVFGARDNIGLPNLLSPAKVLEAARLIRKGAVFPLNMEIDAVSPQLWGSRGNSRRNVIHQGSSIAFDDVYDNYFPQASSQWDSLGHVGYAPGVFYNGATEDDVAAGRRNTIDHWARRGLVGRGIVLDMVRTMQELDRPYNPGSSTAFTVSDLESARECAGIDMSPGDILILHTGFTGWYLKQNHATRVELSRTATTPGLAPGEEMCRYLWDSHVCAVASDTFAVEVTPLDMRNPTGFLHRMLIGQFGMALGELWWTEDLAADCAADGVYEIFLASSPMNAAGGLGSPANALAIK